MSGPIKGEMRLSRGSGNEGRSGNIKSCPETEEKYRKRQQAMISHRAVSGHRAPGYD